MKYDDNWCVFEGPAPRHGVEEIHVTEGAWTELRSIGAIDDKGRLMPDEHLKAMKLTHWCIMKAVVGQTHG